MRVRCALLFFVIFSSCDQKFEEKELYGFYSPIDYKNTYDTIQLKPNGVLQRRVYDRNRTLVLNQSGKWQLDGNTIIKFRTFFVNLDRDVAKFPELLADTLGGWGAKLKKKQHGLKFCVGHDINENCYQKIKKTSN
jgi:hypothetical protein